MTNQIMAYNAKIVVAAAAAASTQLKDELLYHMSLRGPLDLKSIIKSWPLTC